MKRNNSGGSPLRRVTVIVTAVIAAMMGLTGTSGAGPYFGDEAARPVGKVVEVPMNAVGFNPDVAMANGYEIRTRPDGTQYSVKRGTPLNVIPMDVVVGNCGRSWMWLDAIGGRSVRINTGFHVRDAVSTFSWTATLADTGGTTKHDFLPFYDADGYVDLNRIVGGLSTGYARATIYGFPFQNFAVLVDGTVCYSGGPSDDAYIT